VITEPAHYSLEAAASSVNLVRGGTARITVNIKRAPGYHEAIRFSFEKLPPGLTSEECVSAPDATQAVITLHASAEAVVGRQRGIILGESASGESQEAAKISLVVD
jgi:hypothetical protein